MTRDVLLEDAQRMEEACERTVNRCDIWQDRIIYWIAVAVLHLLLDAIKKKGGAKDAKDNDTTESDPLKMP